MLPWTEEKRGTRNVERRTTNDEKNEGKLALGASALLCASLQLISKKKSRNSAGAHKQQPSGGAGRK
jgi:hypothetical protein